MFKKLLIFAIIIAFSLSGCEIGPPLSNDGAAELQQSRAAALHFYVEDGNSLTVTDNFDRFLSETAEDAKIEIVFELQYDNMPSGDLRESVNPASTIQEVDSALARQREEAQEFYTTNNAAFLNERWFAVESELYITTISHFSPHIIKAFNSLAAFEAYSHNIAVLRKSRSVQRMSVMEAPKFENRATLEDPGNAPHYPMTQVRQDTGIVNKKTDDSCPRNKA